MKLTGMSHLRAYSAQLNRSDAKVRCNVILRYKVFQTRKFFPKDEIVGSGTVSNHSNVVPLFLNPLLLYDFQHQ